MVLPIGKSVNIEAKLMLCHLLTWTNTERRIVKSATMFPLNEQRLFTFISPSTPFYLFYLASPMNLTVPEIWQQKPVSLIKYDYRSFKVDYRNFLYKWIQINHTAETSYPWTFLN